MSGKVRIYFISGLGADRRAFRKLKFPADFELVYLDWIVPIPDEQLEDYAIRLASSIDNTTPFYLVGLSMGGMMATEIAKKLNPIHTFLISSVPTYKQIPWYFKLAGKLKLQKMVTARLIKQARFIPPIFLGGKTPEERVLLKTLILDSDPIFMKWALTSILEWRNTEKPENLTHIHGNRDFTLPARYCQPDVIINGAGHFMVYANAKEVSLHVMEKINIRAVDDRCLPVR
uniref:alpha/beta hydrolase n=1 Tax=Pedobacter schmidteae TaxID=2201271 RepID=UPI000EAC39F8|nr:alpha/beta hydrolase [Pedobacter schmidteae]